MKSVVYFSKTNNKNVEERAGALKRLIKAADPFAGCKKDEIIPVKITIGDSQCVYHVSPELVKIVVSELKAKKARPFLFDTNVIYKGERQNAVDHLTLANNKGFGHSKIGAPFVVADGLLGQDGKEHHIHSDHINKIKTPSFVGMTDSLVVISHVTGHILAGYAGAIKNVAMGMSCKPTKQVQHSSVKPCVTAQKCTACGCCISICPVSAISWKEETALIDPKVCVGCGECLCACKFDAIGVNWKEDALIFCKKIADTAEFILSKFKNKFFINFLFDVTKECDCISAKNEQIIMQDLGILASTDALSVDKAAADLINKGEDVFLKAQGRGEYNEMFKYAAQKKLGNLGYDLKIV